MSQLANQTENTAIKILVRCLQHFDKLSDLKMTAEDAFNARSAENQIRSIIETNGFVIIDKAGKNQLKKVEV